MDIAIVTGASSSLGLAISRRLMQMGFRVYGLGGDYANCPLNNVNFKPYPCDLSDPQAVEQAAKQILEKEKGVYVLVNNAKYFGRHDFFEMETREMEQILRVNLLCPLVLARTLANSLMTLQGFLIQLGSPWAETSRGGPVGAAASGGLKWMGDVLFQDLRHQGVKVCHLSPEPNRGRDPRSVARPGARTEASIDPEAVAQAVEQILQSPFGNIVTEMVMRPLRVKEPEHDPVVRLPMPHPKPVPYTVPREFIEAEEQLEDEEIEKNLRRKRERRRSKKQAQKPLSQKDKEPQKGREPRQAGKESPKPERMPDEEREAKAEQKPAPKDDARAGPESAQPRRRSRRKPKPPKAEVGFLDKAAAQPVQEKPADPPGDGEQKAAKKTARKTSKKAAAKKAATKKTAARKAATKKSAVKKKSVPRKSARKSASKKSARKQAAKPEPDAGKSG